MQINLFESIEAFVDIAKHFDAAELEKPWGWRFYDGEGLRFAFFRTFEELQELAVKLESEREKLGKPLTSAQRILGQYHIAFRELENVLLSVSGEIEETPPREGEWSIRETLAHIVRADLGFYVAVRYAMERHRSDDGRPAEIPEEAWDRLSGLDESAYANLVESPYPNLRQFHGGHHVRILEDFADLSDLEMDLGSKYWEEEEMSLRFRLHRFESHMRQHTVQIEKALSDLGHVPNEAKQLSRFLYRALAGCENAMIGTPNVGEGLRKEVVRIIDERVGEIESSL